MADIGVVLTLHREGLLAQPSLASALLCRAMAEAAGASVTLTAIADRPDEATRAVLAEWRAQGVWTIEADTGDAGLSRNAGIAATEARYVALLDGDDLWGEGWLAQAFRAAEAHGGPAVWHPEASLYFGPGGDERWFLHPDSTRPGFDADGAILVNPWTALCFAPRALMLAHPYPASDLARGFGYEDWSWNCRTLAAGIAHRVVPGTVHLIRQKRVSLVRRTEAMGALMVPC